MANKSGKRATKVSAFTEREWKDIRSLLAKAGSQEELFQRIRECPPAEPSGRPNPYPIRDVWMSDGPRGTKLVRFSVGDKNYVVIADPKPRVSKPWPLKYKKLRPALREAVGTLKTLKGFDPANTALWVIRELPKGKYRPEED